MSASRRYLFRLPNIFYVLAVVFFVWSVGNSFWELNLTYANALNDDPLVTYAKSKALFTATLDSVYLVANGAMIHVLLLIFERIKSDD